MTLTTEVSFIDQMQDFEEKMGMESQRMNANIRIRIATEEALKECNMSSNFITEIRSSCATTWEIHISGVVNKEKRKELVECIAKKMNCNKDSIAIIAWYY